MFTKSLKTLKNLSLAFCLSSGGVCFAAVDSGSPIDFFSDLRAQNTQSLEEVEKVLEKSDEDSGRLAILKLRKKELQSRQQFLNRMILQFDANFKGGDIQQFLKVALREMSQVDVTVGSDENSLWKFMNYLAMSIDSLPEGQMDILKFVEGYMKRSSFSAPVDPKEYLSSLDYYNGVEAERANGMSASEAAESL